MICPFCRKRIPTAAAQIRAALRRAGIGPAELARRLRVPAPRVSEWLHGTRTPRNLERILEAIGR